MSKPKSCYLTAVLSEDGTKVVQICTASDGFPLPTKAKSRKGLTIHELIKQNSKRWQMMSCDLSNTVIQSSERQKAKLEHLMETKKKVDRLNSQVKEQAKIYRWLRKPGNSKDDDVFYY